MTTFCLYNAPMKAKKEVGDYPMRKIEIVDAFYEYGWDTPSVAWKVVVARLSRAYSIDRKDTRLLERCKLAHARGVRAAKKNGPAITVKAREYARQHP